MQTDPFGADVGTYDPGPEQPGDVGQYYESHEFGNADDPSRGCTMDGISIDCNTAMRFVRIGAADICPNNNCGPRLGANGWEFWNGFSLASPITRKMAVTVRSEGSQNCSNQHDFAPFPYSFAENALKVSQYV